MWHGRGEALEWQDGHREGADEGYTQVRVAKQVPETAKGVVSRDDPAHEDEALVRSLVRLVAPCLIGNDPTNWQPSSPCQPRSLVLVQYHANNHADFCERVAL